MGQGQQIRDSDNCTPNLVHDWSEAKKEDDIFQSAKKAKANARKSARKAQKPQTVVQHEHGVASRTRNFVSDASGVDDYVHERFPDNLRDERPDLDSDGLEDRVASRTRNFVSDAFDVDDYDHERFPDYLRDERPDLDSDGLEDLYLQQMQDDADEFGGQCDSD